MRTARYMHQPQASPERLAHIDFRAHGSQRASSILQTGEKGPRVKRPASSSSPKTSCFIYDDTN